jgi:hypothetical protein
MEVRWVLASALALVIILATIFLALFNAGEDELPADPPNDPPPAPPPDAPRVEPAVPAPVGTPAPTACAYAPLDDARRWACRPSDSTWHATERAARAACSASKWCKGYFRDPRGYATSTSLPSECVRPATAADAPVVFHAKAAHVTAEPASDAKRGKWSTIESKALSACAAPAARRNSTYRVCAKADKSSSRCAYVGSGVLDPSTCAAAPERPYAAFVPKLASSAFGPSRPHRRAASCAYRVVADEADAKCVCAADARCAGYYADAGRYALSVAEPGACEVDWALDESAIAAQDACSVLGEQWASTASAEKYCAPKCEGAAQRHVMCLDSVTPPCPAGWAAENNRCLPPCPRARGRGGWCTMSTATQPACPPGFEKYKSDPTGMGFLDSASEFFTGASSGLTQYLCVPTAKELASVVRTAARA